MSLEYRLHQRCACGSELSCGERFLAAADAPSSFVLRGTERVYERPLPFRIEHIALELTLDHVRSQIRGSAVLEVARVKADAAEIKLDAVGFDLRGVHLRHGKRGAWRPAHHVYDGETLRVTLPPPSKKSSLRIQYTTRPRRGMYFLRPDEQYPQRPTQVWTQCQDEDARHIFPCHDKPHVKQTFDIDIRTEPGWFALSNGDLVGNARERKQGHFRYRMRQAMPTYLFTVVAGDFEVIEDGVGDLPVTYFVPPGRREDGERTFKHTPEMIRLFEKLTGIEYPWTKYAQIVVSDFIFGGMENTGATTMYEHILLDERAAIDMTSDDLIAHELAHQWFGDLVTCRDWSHAWLNEGFATYMEHVWRQHHLGQDEYHAGLAVDLRAYLSEASGRYQRPVVCQDYQAPIDIFDRHLYEKGALFLHALRVELGDDVFWRGVRLYLERHAGGVVETRDLLRAMEEVSGESLEQFFEDRLLRAGHPRVTVTVEHDEGILTVSVKQNVKDSRPFTFDLDVDIAHPKARKPARETRRVHQAAHTFAFACPERPRYVVIDPELRIIGAKTLRAPADMLRNQLSDAPTARGRTLAAKALAHRDDPATVRSLGRVLANPRQFWGTRVAAAGALANIRNDEAFELLVGALKTRHPKVRRGVVHALGSFRTPAAVKHLEKPARGDESVLVSAAACRALGMTRQKEALDLLVALLDRDSWADTLRAGAIEGLAELRHERAIEHVRGQTAYGAPSRARRAAIAALPEISQSRKTRELLEELLDDRDPHLRVAVAIALGEVGDPKARPALQRQLDRDLDGRVRRRIREVLRDLGGRGRRDMRQLRDEVETLRRHNHSLETRIAKLEERVSAKSKKR